ncbi:nonribosomal peptide synthase [Penicillium maclennaniae]|uniref:nonribosomal peptide synthase n=1 Tax=Penicillium maclennaniae TaxID=1343394 RepID=UPI002541A7EF|nr:nonribosomal peptide synthase [Penicillium maclennaniae]KAJ5668554.1 nonribosomal peptide synthase [Penicillium maclennaniae]
MDEEFFTNVSSATVETLLSPISPRNVAYVIFTSGSSGKPKGVMIQHQTICTSLISSAKTLRLHDSDRALQFASYSFDASILEIFGTLLAGGTVCTPSQEECLDSLQQAMCKYEPTWAILTPSVVQILSPKDVNSLKTLVLGGEQITIAAIVAWKDEVQLVNAYGPTECSILCAAIHVQGLQDIGVIGHPLGSAHWLVDPDDHNRLVPLGTVGDLLVEGPIVAKGYLNDPDRTAAAFIDHPSWRQSIDLVPRSAYMYKTGDLVRWNENGTLSYLGRKDQQLKVRGQRLELEEIESKISHDGLDRKAIIQPTKGPFAKKLVALFTLRNLPAREEAKTEEIVLDLCKEAANIITRLRTVLSERLPDYMVPDKWIPVAGMPLSSAAKMNRKHLVECVETMSETT